MRARTAVVVSCAATVLVASLACIAVAAGATSKSASVDPISVTFVSATNGWVLGTTTCSKKRRCLTLLHTVNAGSSWIHDVLPPSLVKDADGTVNGTPGTFFGLNVRFADLRDGWIFGELPEKVHQGSSTYETFAAALWATHDGGTTWSRETLPGAANENGDIFDVEASRGTVYAMAQNKQYRAVVESSPVGKDHWRKVNDVALNPPAGGGSVGGSIVLSGTSGWLVYGNDRGTTGSAQLASNGTWIAWRPPCVSVGHGLAVPAAANARDLVAVCGMGGFAYPMPASAPPGATPGSSWIYESTNGGASFHVVAEIRPVTDNESWGDFFGVLAMPQPGEIFVSRRVGSATDLIITRDNGAHWFEVYPRELSFLDFVNVNEGVGLATLSDTSNEMIMTFNGGLHWSPVSL